MHPYDHELNVAVAAVREAAAVVVAYYARASVAIYTKHDASPVTDADLESDRILRRHLAAAFPGDAILTEEGADSPDRLRAERVWIADPLDGTRQFIERTGEFDIFLALVIDGRPVVAVAGHPVTGTLLTAVTGAGAAIEDELGRRPLRVDPAPALPRLGISHSYSARHEMPRIDRIASAAALLAPAAATTFSPRAFFALPDSPARYESFLGPGPEPANQTIGGDWDLAAPDLILHEAGGVLTDHRGALIQYNQSSEAVWHGMLAVSDRALHQRLVAALRAEQAAG